MTENIWVRSNGHRNIEVMSYGQSRKRIMSNNHSNDNFFENRACFYQGAAL